MSQHYRQVGSYDALRQAGGAQDVCDQGTCDVSITQRIEQLQQDLQRAQQRGDTESIQWLKGEIARMERREQEEGPHAGV